MAFRDKDEQTYDNWKKLTLIYDKTNQQLCELAKRPLVPAHCPPSPPPAQHPINSRGDIRDSSSVHFWGCGEPMDLSYQKAKK